MSIAKIKGKNAFERDDQQQQQFPANPKSKIKNQKSTVGLQNTSNNNNNHQKPHSQSNINGPAAAKATAPSTTIATSSAEPSAVNQQQQQQQQPPSTSTPTQSTYLPQSSLLKIEPFVPSLNTRLRRRPIGRSLSTLSINNTTSTTATSTNNIATSFYKKRPSALNLLKALPDNKNANAAELLLSSPLETTHSTHSPTSKATRSVVNQRRLPLRGTVTRQRSKSTSSTSTSTSNQRPTTATTQAAAASANVITSAQQNTVVGGTLIGGALVTPQPNGICRIARLLAEQEKLPDRINYDRRGLTAIPIFENEPSLRLLSLQHNLINIFCIPKEVPPPPPPAPPPTAATEAADETASQCSTHSPQLNGRKQFKQTYQYPASPSASPKPRLKLPNDSGIQSPTSSSPFSTQTMMMPSLMGAPRKLFKRNSLQQKNFNFNTPQLPHKQQQQPHNSQQAPPPLLSRFGLERSKSFVSHNYNYSKHYNHMKRNFQRANAKLDTKLFSPLLATANLKSFDCGASGLTSDSAISTLVASELEEDEHLQQLQIKNEQLRASYGMIFQHLVFLDLYDNQIERIGNLDGLSTLSVLLLGKNRISDISGLSSLQQTLRVLDLHGNKISSISNKINCLRLLKSLNLAGNQIRQINHNDFNGLVNLKELNLKRNKIKRINGFQHLSALERLWLCHNDLHKVDDMSSIAKAESLLEVTIENNPVSLAGDCVSFLVSYLPRLQSLSQMPITDQVRQAAMAWRKHKELSESAQTTPDVFNNNRREEVISNARTNWELLRSQQSVHTALRKQRDGIKPSELAKINESVEAGVGFEELQEIIKLPAIEQNATNTPTSTTTTITVRQPTTHTAANEKEEEDQISECRSRSSASSLGPNIDSSSSCFSSDNEDDSNEHKQRRNLVAAGQPAVKDKDTASTLSSPSSTHTNDSAKQSSNVTERTSTTNTTNTTQPSSGKAQHLSAAAPTGESKSRSTTPTNQPTVGGQRIPTTIVGQLPSTHNTPTTSCRRYMQGSLMRSHTIGNSQAAAQSRARRTNSPSPAKNGPNKLTPNQITTNGSQTLTATSNAKATVTTASPLTTNTPAATNPPGTASNSAATANSQLAVASTKPTATEREREQGGDYLIEICGRYLNIYGQGALRFIDKQWNPSKANDVHTLNFSYINFNNITAILARIKVRFPHAENFVFRETNISSLGQLNALAELQGIASLYIDPEGNPITTKQLWRQYAIYRLSHWGLKMLNGHEVTESEVEESNSTYAGLSDLVLWSMPEVMLQPLLTRLRLDETCTASKMSPKQWLMKADNKSLRLVVGKEALQWKKAGGNGPSNQATQQYIGQIATLSGNRAMFVTTGANGGSNTMQSSTGAGGNLNAALSNRERGKMHFTLMLENTCNAVEKLHKLETLWPSLLLDMVRNTLLDYSQLDTYLRNVLNEIMEQH